jgi:hypothetical protein
MFLMKEVIQNDHHQFNFLEAAKRLEPEVGDDLILGIFITGK